MKLSNIFSILTDLRLGAQHAFRPTFLALLRNPGLLFCPRSLSRLVFAHVWELYGDGVDARGHQVKDDLLSANAYGLVLDIGAGHGHTGLYLSPSRVTKYVALEPNILMHSHIRAKAARAGFTEDSGTLLVLSCGAEDVSAIALALDGQHQVDTLVSILSLCSVPEPERTIRLLTDQVLKPGGQLLFYEHVASHRRDVQFWQRFWTPLWKMFFDGCVLDRPTDSYIRNLGNVWEDFPQEDTGGGRSGIWGEEGSDEETLRWHQVGRLIKRIP